MVALPDQARHQYPGHAEFLAQLTWKMSYAAAATDADRSELVDAELCGMEWGITFRRRPEVMFPCCFHDDGCYEDVVFFSRHENHCTWGPRAALESITGKDGRPGISSNPSPKSNSLSMILEPLIQSFPSSRRLKKNYWGNSFRKHSSRRYL
jgi:hypothetical protein